MTPNRLTPEREAVLRELYYEYKEEEEYGLCEEEKAVIELFDALDALRKEADHLKDVSLLQDYLAAEKLRSERDALKARNEKLRQILKTISEGLQFTDSKNLGIKLLSIAQIKQLIKEALS